MSDHIEPAMLASIQPLPPADRRRMVLRHPGTDAPEDLRDDEAFYAWLADIYEVSGSRGCDAALTQAGGNSARRTLAGSALTWATEALKRDGVAKRELSPFSLDLLIEKAGAHGRDDIVAAMSWVDGIVSGGGGAPPSGVHDATGLAAAKPQPADVPAVVAGDPVGGVRALLDRLERTGLDVPAHELLETFADRLSTMLAERDAQRLASSAAADQAVAAEAFATALAALPAGQRERFGEVDTRGASATGLDAAVAALGSLWEANAALALAAGRQSDDAGKSRAERMADLTARLDAEEAVEAAFAEASEAIALFAATANAAAGPVDRPSAGLDPLEELDATAGLIPAFAAPPTAVDGMSDGPAAGPDMLDGPELLEFPTEEAAWVDDAPVADEPADVPVGSADPWDDWVALALDNGTAGLAAHLAHARTLANADLDDSWPAIVIEGAVVGRNVAAAGDRASTRYAALAPALETIAASLDVHRDVGMGQALAVIAGAVRASLVANYDGARVIDALPRGGPLTDLLRLTDFARDGAKLGIQAIAELARPAEQHQRERQRRAATDNLARWFANVQSRTLPYQLATLMWQRDFIAPNGLIGGPITAVIDGDPGALAQATALAVTLRDESEDVLDRHFDAMLNKSRARTLDGIARERMLALMTEARDVLDAWIRIDAGPKAGPDRLERLRNELLAGLDQAGVALATLHDDAGEATRRGSALLRDVVDGVRASIRGEDRMDYDPDRALDDEIALLADFPLNGRIGFRVGLDDVEPLRAAAGKALGDAVPGWAAAFDRAIELGAASVAQRILPFLPRSDETLQLRIDACIVEQRQKLERDRQTLRAQLDDLQSASTGDTVTNQLEGALVGLETFDLTSLPSQGAGEAGGVGDFPTLADRLGAFGRRLGAARATVVAQLSERIGAIERDGEPLDDCRALLLRGDLGTLAEDLAQIERHGHDRASVRPKDLLAEVDWFAREVLAQAPDDRAVQSSLRDAARQGRRCGAFRFDQVPESERVEASALLDAWVRLKQTGQGPNDALNLAIIDLFGAIGFSGIKIAQQGPWRGGRRLEVRVDPLRTADACIVPAFGSEAGGAYTVLVMPRGTLEKSLAGFDELPDRVIALATEWLTPKARAAFLRRSRSRPAASYALLDDPAVGSLAATAARNLRSFFNLAIPFGAAHPYADKAAATSVEMFFGRQREYDQLVDPQGSCLVFGGRQLGKTALLRQIELRNAGNHDFAIVYRDIKRVGSSEIASSVWDRIGEGLALAGIGRPDARGGETVADTIRAWLRAQPQRRILMLLDEADAFLESEMESDFAEIMTMKGLMEDTGRRAKFVFAGLHNVQRFVRTPNSPMLHLGEPVNIGPLLGHDRDAARRMVFEPMAAVGVGFRHDTDAHHMLSLVGYYPSLLQTFGKSLLASVDSRLGRSGEASELPILLDRETVAEGFKAAEFRNELLSKFRATLELDPRYELITYVVCYRAEEDRAQGRVLGHGYASREIYKLALEHWPQGFTDIRSADTFGALLDEMDGLGVLARDGERYALRSARIAAMLGGHDRIETRLLEFADRPREHKSDPLANHRMLDNGGYSPLSLRLERTLIDQLRSEKQPVSVVFLAGSEAVADWKDLTLSLRSLAQSQNWPAVRELAFRDLEGLRTVVAASRRDARLHKPKLIICRGRWPDAGEMREIDRMRELRDASAPVRLLFLGGAAELVFSSAIADQARQLKTAVIDLAPWDGEAVHHWLARHADGASSDRGFSETVLRITGGFASVFDQVRLPKNLRLAGDDILRRLEASATKTLRRGAIGLVDDRLISVVRTIHEWDEPDGLDESTLRDLACEIDDVDGLGALDGLKRLGLLMQIQTAGEPRWRLKPVVAALLDDTVDA